MEKNTSHQKYDEIFREIKEEKMVWDFEAFLAQTEKTKKIDPEISEKKSASFPKFYLLAASLVLLVSLGLSYHFFREGKVAQQDTLVKTEILKQKSDFEKSNGAVAAEDSVSSVSPSGTAKVKTAVAGNENDVLDKILAKRGRLKKQAKPKYVQADRPEISKKTKLSPKPTYEAGYVVINGQKIENEQEAIDLTKYSFRILSENVTKTVAQTEVLNSNNDY